MIALEADEVSVTQKSQPLKPVWPSDSLAGVPEHSPIPLAETVVDGVSNVQHSAKQVQRTADGMLRHSVYGIFDGCRGDRSGAFESPRSPSSASASAASRARSWVCFSFSRSWAPRSSTWPGLVERWT